MSNKNYVTYEEFGAVGDGVTDDFVAIYKAHEYANANADTNTDQYTDSVADITGNRTSVYADTNSVGMGFLLSG